LVIYLFTIDPVTVAIAWIIPITFLYHAASLLQFVSEHWWGVGAETTGHLPKNISQNEMVKRSRSLTAARFCGEPVPKTFGKSQIMSALLWGRWLSRMLFFHLPCRLFALSGDLVQHDWHHRVGFGADWANAAYAREKMATSLKPTDVPFLEIWGLNNAIDHVFEQLSKMEPLQLENDQIDHDMVLGM
jgi:hypothetical protein